MTSGQWRQGWDFDPLCPSPAVCAVNSAKGISPNSNGTGMSSGSGTGSGSGSPTPEKCWQNYCEGQSRRSSSHLLRFMVENDG